MKYKGIINIDNKITVNMIPEPLFLIFNRWGFKNSVNLPISTTGWITDGGSPQSRSKIIAKKIIDKSSIFLIFYGVNYLVFGLKSIDQN